jgi:glycosyltransferase involved in cell wall biosynthesis
MAVYNIGFVMEQTLGHITHTQNLQRIVPADAEVRAHWALVPYSVEGLAARIPGYGSNWTVRAGLRARTALANLSRGARLDALLFHTQVPAVLCADWLRRVPSIVSLDATPLQYDQLGTQYDHAAGTSWAERAKWKLNHACFQAARHLVAWSRWARHSLIEEYGIPADKITVVAPGVDLRAWRRPAPRKAGQGPLRLLFVGGNFARKGGTQLLEAFRALRPRGAELHLVTQTPLAPEPGLFVYHDIQPNSAELRALYHSCDIFVLPTLGDCLPLVLAEAAAAGLPTISTTIAAIPEIVRDGDTGLLVPPGDVRALEDALQRLLQQPELRQRLGERAASLAAREHDLQKNVGRLLDLLKGEVDVARMHMRMAA